MRDAIRRNLRTLRSLLKIYPPVIEGSQRDHLYPLTPTAVRRQRTDQDIYAAREIDRNALRRRTMTATSCMSHCEVTSLIIAAKSPNII